MSDELRDKVEEIVWGAATPAWSSRSPRIAADGVLALLVERACEGASLVDAAKFVGCNGCSGCDGGGMFAPADCVWRPLAEPWNHAVPFVNVSVGDEGLMVVAAKRLLVCQSCGGPGPGETVTDCNVCGCSGRHPYAAAYSEHVRDGRRVRRYVLVAGADGPNVAEIAAHYGATEQGEDPCVAVFEVTK